LVKGPNRPCFDPFSRPHFRGPTYYAGRPNGCQGKWEGSAEFRLAPLETARMGGQDHVCRKPSTTEPFAADPPLNTDPPVYCRYSDVVKHTVRSPCMKPLIGISPTPENKQFDHGDFRRYTLANTYTTSVLAAGGIPVILPPHTEIID